VIHQIMCSKSIFGPGSDCDCARSRGERSRPDRRAAIHGCVGTGVEWAKWSPEHVCETLADRHRPGLLGRWCTADDAVRAGVRHE
jgi:hypothetical protein